jgi:hypothetical protein
LLREEEEQRRGLERRLAQAEERAAAATDLELASARRAASEAAAATAEGDPLRPLLIQLDRKITALEHRKDKVEDELKREIGLLERKVAALERQLRDVYEDRRGGAAGGGAAAAKDGARLLWARTGGVSASRDDADAGVSLRTSARPARGSGGARGTDELTSAERAESKAELMRVQRDQRLARLDPEAAASESKRRAEMEELRNRIIMTQARAAAESHGMVQGLIA